MENYTEDRDHSPLLGGCDGIPKPKNTPLIFQKLWLSYPDFLRVVADFWSARVEGMQIFCQHIFGHLSLFDFFVFVFMHVSCFFGY